MGILRGVAKPVPSNPCPGEANGHTPGQLRGASAMAGYEPRRTACLGRGGEGMGQVGCALGISEAHPTL